MLVFGLFLAKGLAPETKQGLELPDIQKVASRRIHVWYIYLHEWLICMVNVGRYTSPMDPMWLIEVSLEARPTANPHNSGQIIPTSAEVTLNGGEK